MPLNAMTRRMPTKIIGIRSRPSVVNGYLVANRRISTDRVIEGKEKLGSIVNLLTKMIENLSEDSS